MDHVAGDYFAHWNSRGYNPDGSMVHKRYSMGDGDRACIEQYALQFLVGEHDDDPDDLTINIVYPCRIPDGMFYKYPLPVPDKETIFVVFEILTGDIKLGDIRTEILVWDGEPRIRWLWHADPEDKIDPADTMSDTDEKWVKIVFGYSEKDARYCYDSTDAIKENRGFRTNFIEAGGQCVDKLAIYYDMHAILLKAEELPSAFSQKFRQKEYCYVFMEQIIRGYDYTQVGYVCDRAHADDMLKPSEREKERENEYG